MGSTKGSTKSQPQSPAVPATTEPMTLDEAIADNQPPAVLRALSLGEAEAARVGLPGPAAPRLTAKILDAMNAALAAALAGEEGEGDMTDTSHEDLHAAQRWVWAQQSKRS